MPPIRSFALVCLAVTLGALPAVASKAAIDLRDGPDVLVEGTGTGTVVSSGGDINGDGVPDMLIGSCRAPVREWSSGVTYALFGSSGQRTIALADPTTYEGFRIEGGSQETFACAARSVGDINGDGLDDVAVGSLGADPQRRAEAGVVYIVFGKDSSTPVNLSAFDLGVQGEPGSA